MRARVISTACSGEGCPLSVDRHRVRSTRTRPRESDRVAPASMLEASPAAPGGVPFGSGGWLASIGLTSRSSWRRLCFLGARALACSRPSQVAETMVYLSPRRRLALSQFGPASSSIRASARHIYPRIYAILDRSIKYPSNVRVCSRPQPSDSASLALVGTWRSEAPVDHPCTRPQTTRQLLPGYRR
jgi:hypothetical protein